MFNFLRTYLNNYITANDAHPITTEDETLNRPVIRILPAKSRLFPSLPAVYLINLGFSYRRPGKVRGGDKFYTLLKRTKVNVSGWLHDFLYTTVMFLYRETKCNEIVFMYINTRHELECEAIRIHTDDIFKEILYLVDSLILKLLMLKKSICFNYLKSSDINKL